MIADLRPPMYALIIGKVIGQFGDPMVIAFGM
jgi:hypothetical protein